MAEKEAIAKVQWAIDCLKHGIRLDAAERELVTIALQVLTGLRFRP